MLEKSSARVPSSIVLNSAGTVLNPFRTPIFLLVLIPSNLSPKWVSSCKGGNEGVKLVIVGALTPPTRLQEKMRSLERLLEGGEGGLLDEAKLRGITSTGVPDMGGLRPILWRYLLR